MTDDDWWEQHSLDRIPIPEDIEQAIIRPHSHETEHSPPLWLIWVRARFGRGLDVDPEKLDFPTLDSVCDSEKSARAHYRMAVYHSHHGTSRDVVQVERVPANHRFASSLGNWQHDAHMSMWKARAERNKREGD